MSGNEKLVQAYARLERQIQCCMADQSRGACSRCLQKCCRIDFCRESLQSPFLVLVRARCRPRAPWDPRAGWLTPWGCALSAGRPPVCYEFICRDLEKVQPTEGHRKALHFLSGVVTEVGRCARGKAHLIELNDLTRINRARLLARIEQAAANLEKLRLYWEERKGCLALLDL